MAGRGFRALLVTNLVGRDDDNATPAFSLSVITRNINNILYSDIRTEPCRGGEGVLAEGIRPGRA